ncbi:F-box/LRR-repeat protein 14 [Toxorhynchites rutilus septentrionalis]|uniref:F-box/LRR-repeat protein 14 n=1 Tax=Toxorhynchites rutilus septentrionalis TaxID=329112 RepID=UPI002479E0C4|nr:F-box/LRR-repeat protein 14 [Toxorhynchites rutilus septentrionalis]
MMMEEANFMLTEISGGFISHRPHAIHRFVPYPLHQPHLQPAPIYIHPQPRLVCRSKTPPTPPPPEGTHIGHLYPEILAIIFEKLSVKDRGRAAQVCTVWRDAAYSKSCWKGVEASLHLRRPSPSLFTSLVKRGIKKVQVLSMRRTLKEVVVGISNLESLNLSGCYNITDIALGHAFPTDLPNLKVLDLSLCKQVTDSSLGRIAQHLKNIEVLELGGCCNITNTGLLLIAWGLKKLKRLNLRSCWHVSDQGIGHLAGIGKEAVDGTLALEYLGLQDCQRLSDESLRHIAQGLTSLKSINLSFCVSITDSGLKHLAKMAKLEELNLRACDNISDIGIAYLTEGGSSISSLDVSFCDKIADQALTHISQGLFHLKSLSLSACQITDEGLEKIAKSLHDLETLNIGQCSRVTDRGLEIIAEELKNLCAIDLYGCTRLSPVGLSKIYKLSRLSKVNLGLWHVR